VKSETLCNSIEEEICRFVLHSTLLDLMESFGYNPPQHPIPLGEKINAQKLFSNQFWDFRGGGERSQAVKAVLTSQQNEKIMQAAAALGMTEAIKPQQVKYDAIIILGAGGMHPLWRTQYAEQCGAKAPTVVALGSNRKIEHVDYAPVAKTEFDLMSAAIERVYRGKIVEKHDIINSVTLYPNRDYTIRYYVGQGLEEEPNIFVLSAPSSHQSRRTNTPDTYAFLAKLLPREAKNLLIVTSSNFKPFQHFDALRMLALPHEKNVETIGFDTRKSLYHAPQQYLQEMNSAINSASALYTLFLNICKERK
jgi:hypothetical protein